jgi:hybrid cluster-associated redox disulfide protein
VVRWAILSCNDRHELGRGGSVRFTKDMLIRDALLAHPGAIGVFQAHDLPCAACMAADMESLESVATLHGCSVGRLLKDLNALPEEDEVQQHA